MTTPVPGADHACAKCVHPEPVNLRVIGSSEARWRWREWILRPQSTKTLIEPRLELPCNRLDVIWKAMVTQLRQNHNEWSASPL